MSHAYFPEEIPGEDTLNKLMAKQRLVQGSTASRCIVEVQGKDGDIIEINIPGSYFNHMQCCMWRESATQVVLDHANQLGLWEDLTNTLIKVLWYMGGIFEQIAMESCKAAAKTLQWQSGAFNSYLRIEEFRHNNDMNINQCNIQELANDMQFLRTLHGHMEDFYDPIVAEDTNFGYTFKEHLLPVEELNQEEGGNQEGVGEQQDQDDALSEESFVPVHGHVMIAYFSSDSAIQEGTQFDRFNSDHVFVNVPIHSQAPPTSWNDYGLMVFISVHSWVGTHPILVIAATSCMNTNEHYIIQGWATGGRLDVKVYVGHMLYRNQSILSSQSHMSDQQEWSVCFYHQVDIVPVSPCQQLRPYSVPAGDTQSSHSDSRDLFKRMRNAEVPTPPVSLVGALAKSPSKAPKPDLFERMKNAEVPTPPVSLVGALAKSPSNTPKPKLFERMKNAEVPTPPTALPASQKDLLDRKFLKHPPQPKNANCGSSPGSLSTYRLSFVFHLSEVHVDQGDEPDHSYRVNFGNPDQRQLGALFLYTLVGDLPTIEEHQFLQCAELATADTNDDGKLPNLPSPPQLPPESPAFPTSPKPPDPQHPQPLQHSPATQPPQYPSLPSTPASTALQQ
ncbi:hypothetical protein EDC04DRAFT_2597897 [Pisolithus marmoratus]|nr:hypothetical protein EDC04DRAFT_2597897 [Pisolithus marmoratus]